MTIKEIFRRSGPPDAVHDLYRRIVEQARAPRFYEEYSVPDTVDGRFEMVALHMILVLRRMRRESESASEISQALFDYMFEDMDVSLREMGAGDMGVGKRVKAMVQAFYGRVASYEEGLAGPGRELALALERNVFGTTDVDAAVVDSLAAYVRAQDEHLAAIDRQDIEAARFEFGVVE